MGGNNRCYWKLERKAHRFRLSYMQVAFEGLLLYTTRGGKQGMSSGYGVFHKLQCRNFPSMDRLLSSANYSEAVERAMEVSHSFIS